MTPTAVPTDPTIYRVVVTFDGKFLPYDWTAAQG